MLNPDTILNIFNSNPEIAFIISILISIIIALIGVLPSIFVTGANVIFFGPILGLIISLLGETIGGYISFKLYRLGLKNVKDRIEGKYKLIDNLLKSEGLRAAALIFEGRIIPFIPSGFITLGASLSKVKDFPFTIATLLGKIPSIALEALISYDIINISQNYIRLGTIIAALIIALLIKKFIK